MDYCNETRCGCCGVRSALWIFVIVLAFAIGIILGAVFSATILANLAAIIVFGVVVLLLFIITLIVRYCRGCTCR